MRGTQDGDRVRGAAAMRGTEDGERVRSVAAMRATGDGDRVRSTAETMHETAAALERSEAILHDSAEKSPDPETTRRLHSLGDEVTRQAKEIDARADGIPPAAR